MTRILIRNSFSHTPQSYHIAGIVMLNIFMPTALRQSRKLSDIMETDPDGLRTRFIGLTGFSRRLPL